MSNGINELGRTSKFAKLLTKVVELKKEFTKFVEEKKEIVQVSKLSYFFSLSLTNKYVRAFPDMLFQAGLVFQVRPEVYPAGKHLKDNPH